MKFYKKRKLIKKTFFYIKIDFSIKKRESEPGRTGTGPNRSRPTPNRTEPNRGLPETLEIGTSAEATSHQCEGRSGQYSGHNCLIHHSRGLTVPIYVVFHEESHGYDLESISQGYALCRLFETGWGTWRAAGWTRRSKNDIPKVGPIILGGCLVATQ